MAAADCAIRVEVRSPEDKAALLALIEPAWMAILDQYNVDIDDRAHLSSIQITNVRRASACLRDDENDFLRHVQVMGWSLDGLVGHPYMAMQIRIGDIQAAIREANSTSKNLQTMLDIAVGKA